MTTVNVRVEKDHLQRLARSGVIHALAELIWNSLDADADRVDITTHRNDFGGIASIVVADNGNGFTHREALEAFESLGGSWKLNSTHTRVQKRILHGKKGEGRFRAFSLGSDIVWRSRYRDEDVVEVTVKASSDGINTFDVSDPAKCPDGMVGTTVTILNVATQAAALEPDNAPLELATYLAPYLKQYSHVEVVYDGRVVLPGWLIRHQASYKLKVLLPEGSEVAAELEIVEWNGITTQGLFLCDENGFALAGRSPGMRPPGYQFTAYVCSDLVRQLYDDQQLELDGLSPSLRSLLDEAKRVMRQHFASRTAESAREAVARWKTEGIYPYDATPTSPVDAAERQVFDILALNVAEYLSDFERGETKTKRLSFRLLKQALETSPNSVRKILTDVLDLSPAKQEQLAELLETTSLESIISACKVVTDRMGFLAGLERLLFHSELRKVLLERSQLHRIVAENTWVFGEEYALVADDKSLTEVLRQHRHLLRDEIAIDEPVLRPDGTEGIIDLMLSRSLQNQNGKREHLIIELKRPSKDIDDDAINQVFKYAMAVAEDDRFANQDVRWVFWAVSDGLNRIVARKANEQGKPRGLYYDANDMDLQIWVKPWGEVIDTANTRLKFFQQHLEWTASDETIMAPLREAYGQYLPRTVRGPDTAS
ncbi:MAG: ATP-binding protein [Armatimonadota bacterium]